MSPQLQPLSYRHRNRFFYLLLVIFAASLPFLFLYASGYRFYLGPDGLVSTGGLYVAAERTGAEIYINDQLVRETRVFRRAFYAQGLDVGTHRVHVQKDGHHTWVKELPVYPHLVTEAQAFNLPIVPDARLITPYRTAAGVAVLTATTSTMDAATISTRYLFEPRAATSTLESNIEFTELIEEFKAATNTISTERPSVITTNVAAATTTKEWRNVQLFESTGEVYARFVGEPGNMPYYYCAETFPRYQPATSTRTTSVSITNTAAAAHFDDAEMLPVQTVASTQVCDPTIRIDRAGETVNYFDFFPGSTDLVIIGSDQGVFVVEIDDRVWQNRQALLLGENLEVRVVNGAVYVYDGTYLYQILIETTWF